MMLYFRNTNISLMNFKSLVISGGSRGQTESKKNT
jgi:hypothetical protein